MTYNVKSGSTIAERLEYYSMPVPECGCKIWLGETGRDGYGRIYTSGKHASAHVVAWEEKNGPVPPGMKVLHSCDTPPCIEEAHLFLGSQQDNVDDMMKKGRHNPMHGEKNGSSKLTVDDVLAIRAAAGLQKEIAAAFGVSVSCVSEIKTFKKWKHLV